MSSTRSVSLLCAVAMQASGAQNARTRAIAPPLALIGATVIDGTGAAPISDATVLVAQGRIAGVGPRGRVTIPTGTRTIDVSGKYITPGLINANIHLTPYFSFGEFSGPDSLLTLGALAAARTLLSQGVTTVRDTYGVLPALLQARERIASGAAEGATLLVAGNIIGWGGPWSYTFSGSTEAAPQTDFARRMRASIVNGMGENLVDLGPDSLRVLVTRYIDSGPDFIKIGVTTHVPGSAFLLFSPRALEAMVGAAHARGRKVDVHAESVEGLRMATLAGVDVLQHPEVVGGARLPSEVVDSIVARGTVCSMMPAVVTGSEWKRFEEHLALGGRMWPAEKPPAMMRADADSLRRIGVDLLARPRTASVTRFRNQRLNAEALIKAGCTVAVASDEVVALPDAASTRTIGEQFLSAIEGLVELGMTPSQALVAATRNGAVAAGRLNEIGTITPGKRADLLLLDADPLLDIRNVRRVFMVIHRGGIVQR